MSVLGSYAAAREADRRKARVGYRYFPAATCAAVAWLAAVPVMAAAANADFGQTSQDSPPPTAAADSTKTTATLLTRPNEQMPGITSNTCCSDLILTSIFRSGRIARALRVFSSSRFWPRRRQER